MDEHDWQPVDPAAGGRYRQERCTDCGATVMRIGVPAVVSQVACTMVPAGADRSSTT